MGETKAHWLAGCGFSSVWVLAGPTGAQHIFAWFVGFSMNAKLNVKNHLSGCIECATNCENHWW